MARVEMTDGWEERLQAPLGDVVWKLCLDVKADAQMICPVDSGDLKMSIDSEVRGTVGRVGSNLDYAAAVEMGFHGIEQVCEYVRKDGVRVRAHERHANQPSEPYLKPSLYTRRSA